MAKLLHTQLIIGGLHCCIWLSDYTKRTSYIWYETVWVAFFCLLLKYLPLQQELG